MTTHQVAIVCHFTENKHPHIRKKEHFPCIFDFTLYLQPVIPVPINGRTLHECKKSQKTELKLLISELACRLLVACPTWTVATNATANRGSNAAENIRDLCTKHSGCTTYTCPTESWNATTLFAVRAIPWRRADLLQMT
jgi:hypothetical protein